MSRKLATIRQIERLSPIKDADFIEVAKIKDTSWEVVVKKGQFKEGDIVVYCEIDSVLPNKPEFAFLESRKFKIKTIKIKGQLSQGIVFPVTILPKNYVALLNEDVSEVLGIIKYEEPEIIGNEANALGKFPAFIPVTDQERIQNIPSFIDDNIDEEFIVTEKLDGTSSTFYLDDNNELIACSRNLRMQRGNNKYYHIADKYKIEEYLRIHDSRIAIQGEIIGHKINGNNYNLNYIDLYVFAIYNIDKKIYEDWSTVEKLCLRFGLKTVPVIAKNTTFYSDITVSSLLDYANRNSEITPTSKAEGLVVRTAKTKSGIFSIKIINNSYLL